MNVPRTRALVVAGPASGVGKTTVALGLMAAFRRRGLTVQGFKCGPDFIDTGHHTHVCGRSSRNLDAWMLSPEVNLRIFAAHAATADISIIEGVMGLFDGARDSGEGSTAAMARALDVPVLLVVDASKMAASAAAVVHGFQTFDPALRVAGVVFNRIAGEGHYELLRDALAHAGCPPTLGYLPRNAVLRIPERHLGLFTAEDAALAPSVVQELEELIEAHVDLTRLLEIATRRSPIPVDASSGLGLDERAPDVRVAVARDRAFCFYYEDNLDALRAAGADLVEFSPLTDRALPAGTSAVYIGGGFPELAAAELAANHEMRAALAEFASHGGPVYAECGGLMYLGRAIRSQHGSEVPMVGALPFTTTMTDGLVRFGYTEVRFTRDCLLGPAGTLARGHSFHYSTLAARSDLPCAYHVRWTLSGREDTEGYVAKNVLASYVHLHFLSQPTLARSLVHAARVHARG